MEPELVLDRDFVPRTGEPVEAAPGVRRITAPNPGPMTFVGTNTYIVGRGTVAVIDPGPDIPEHLAALEAALAGERVAAVLVTHTHRDHSPLARPLASAHGATVYGFGPHGGDGGGLEAAGDRDFMPDVRLADADRVEGPFGSLTALHTPGHTSNHLCFALEGTGILFSGDHVMAWSTTVVAPPDGSMAAYMASLDKLAAREDRLYLPGHGGPVRDPRRHLAALAAHRRARERAILDRLAAGDAGIAELVAGIYGPLDERTARAAGMSVRAHLEDLEARGLAASLPGEPGGTARYRAAASGSPEGAGTGSPASSTARRSLRKS